jgi:hypothetical protein
MIQGLRVAMSFAGIYDEDEAERIIEGVVIEQSDFQSTETKALNQTLKALPEKEKPDARDTGPRGPVDQIRDRVVAAGGIATAEPAEATTAASAATEEDFDLEQPQTDTPFTLVDVKAKIKTIEAKAKKAKTAEQKQEVQDLVDETVDMLSALMVPAAERDVLTKTLSGFVS